MPMPAPRRLHSTSQLADLRVKAKGTRHNRERRRRTAQSRSGFALCAWQREGAGCVSARAHGVIRYGALR